MFTGIHYTIGGRVVRGWGCSGGFGGSVHKMFTGMHYTIGGRVVRGWGCSGGFGGSVHKVFTGMHYTVGGRVVRGWGCSVFGGEAWNGAGWEGGRGVQRYALQYWRSGGRGWGCGGSLGVW